MRRFYGLCDDVGVPGEQSMEMLWKRMPLKLPSLVPASKHPRDDFH
jgi:hypothetical protein